MGKICVITPTRDCPIAFERCNFYLQRQLIKPNYWIIGDSGKKPCKPTVTVPTTIIRKEPHANKAEDFTGNLLNTIDNIPQDVEYVIPFESDDWYHARYIQETITRLETYDLVGSPYAMYYNVRLRSYRKNQNNDRASFCETAFRSNILPLLKFCCQVKRNSAFVDSRLWYSKRFTGAKALFADQRLVVGIKGLPGFPGIGIGHRAPNYRHDPNMSFLERLIGKDDTKWYRKLKF